MDNTCAICFEEMDMNTFRDERQSTETCFKLECNHAFHTKCIVDCLQKTKHRCPSCNEDKSLEKVLTLEGLVLELVDEVKKVENVKLALQEYRNAKTELDESFKAFKEDVKKYAMQKKDEMLITEKYKYYTHCKANVSREAAHAGKLMGGKYRSVFTSRCRHTRMQYFEKGLFGLYSYYYTYQYKYPCIRLTI